MAVTLNLEGVNELNLNSSKGMAFYVMNIEFDNI